MLGDDDDYDQEVEQIYVKEQQDSFDDSERLVLMTGDKTATGVLAAVLQVVLELKTWAEFFVKTEFEEK